MGKGRAVASCEASQPDYPNRQPKDFFMHVTKVAAMAPADDMADMPAEGMDETKPMDHSEDCVSLEALAMPDESEQMENPAVGDKVQYTVEGTVTRIEGGNAYVKKRAVNGKKVEDTAEKPEGEPTDDMASLENDARSMSETPTY